MEKINSKKQKKKIEIISFILTFPVNFQYSSSYYMHYYGFYSFCRLPVCSCGEGWESGLNPDSDLGAQLPHPEAGWGGATLHHPRELPCTQKRTPPRAKVQKISTFFKISSELSPWDPVMHLVFWSGQEFHRFTLKKQVNQALSTAWTFY